MNLVRCDPADVFDFDELFEAVFDRLSDDSAIKALDDYTDGLRAFFKKRGLDPDCEENEDWWREKYFDARSKLEKRFLAKLKKEFEARIFSPNRQ